MSIDKPFFGSQTEHRVAKRPWAVVGLCTVVAALSACGSAMPVGQSESRTPVVVKEAGFTLRDVELSWEQNPDFKYEVKYATMKYNSDKSPTKETRERAQRYISKLNEIFSESAVTALRTELSSRQITFGKSQKVVMTPVSGYFDDTGWGSGIIVRVTINDTITGALWTTEVDSRSGLHWLGGASAPPPSDTFVKNFIGSLMTTWRQAKVLPG